MNVISFYSDSLNLLIKKLLEKYKVKLSFIVKIKIKNNRCSARIWDNVNWDINKRCLNHIYENELCSKHFKKNNFGRINEMPDEKTMLIYYRKYNHNLDNELKLNNNYNFSKIFNLKLNSKNKKKININLGMSLKSVKNLDDIIFNENILNKKKLYEILKDKLSREHNVKHLSLAEHNTLTEKIENIVEKKNKINEQNYSLNNYTSKKDNQIINLIDKEFNYNSVIVGELYQEDCFILYNDNFKKVGYMRYWIDDDEEIPNEFKTKDNIVLDPQNNQKITEIDITPQGSLFLGILPNVYREYEYDEDLEFFRLTNCIQKE
tara:strand:+ start:516 stop:1475 length:960 start_codon:yes stop_codon:yes gene_type:complete